jgi:hypothetical protein
VLIGQGPPVKRRSSGLRRGGIAVAIVAAVFLVTATLSLVEAKSAYDAAKTTDGCPRAGSTVCSTDADTVGVWNGISKVSYVVGGVLGLAGVTMIVVGSSSSPQEPPRLGLAKTWRF